MTLQEAMTAHGVTCLAITPVEIRGDIWICIGFENAGEPLGDHPHLALIHAERDWLEEHDLARALVSEFRGARDVMARVHSECILGDAFGSSMCDCGDQMALSMAEMRTRGRGVFVYLRQEGRGIGLRNKLDCLALQYGFVDGVRGSRRHTSDEANLAMGFAVDQRGYAASAALFLALGIGSVELITGNPRKIADMEAAGVAVTSALDIWTDCVSPRAADELREKVLRGYIYQR